jgi:hypothetical protein
MPYRSEVRRAARTSDVGGTEDSFVPISNPVDSDVSDSSRICDDSRETDLHELIQQLGRSHAALLQSIDNASRTRLRATAIRRPAVAAAAANVEAVAVAVELAALHAARARLEREVRAAMAVRSHGR